MRNQTKHRRPFNHASVLLAVLLFSVLLMVFHSFLLKPPAQDSEREAQSSLHASSTIGTVNSDIIAALQRGDTVYILGYGSLLNMDSMIRTVGSQLMSPEFRAVRVKQLIRYWGDDMVPMNPPLQTSVAVRFARDFHSYITAVLFQPTLQGIMDLILREKNYRLTEVPISQLIDFVDPNGTSVSIPYPWICANPSVYVFASSESIWNTVKHTPKSLRHSISLMYLDVCLSGAIRLGGVSFAQEFIDTTLGWDTVPFIRNDRGRQDGNVVLPEWERITDNELTIINSLLSLNNISYCEQ